MIRGIYIPEFIFDFHIIIGGKENGIVNLSMGATAENSAGQVGNLIPETVLSFENSLSNNIITRVFEIKIDIIEDLINL
jgi:hypothetical protein